MNDQQTAEAHQLSQAEKLLALFEGAHGRPAQTVDELTAWATSEQGKRVITGLSETGH